MKRNTKIFGVTSEIINDWMKNKNFLKPITPSPKTRLWKWSEIDDWLAEIRKEQHDQYHNHYHDDGGYLCIRYNTMEI